MEEEILKIIKECVMPEDWDASDRKTAKEITSHVFEFIEYLMKDVPFWYEEISSKWYDTETDNYMTTNEVYQYWKDNVKDK